MTTPSASAGCSARPQSPEPVLPVPPAPVAHRAYGPHTLLGVPKQPLIEILTPTLPPTLPSLPSTALQRTTTPPAPASSPQQTNCRHATPEARERRIGALPGHGGSLRLKDAVVGGGPLAWSRPKMGFELSTEL